MLWTRVNPKRKDCAGWRPAALKTHITRGDIARLHSPAEMRKLLNRKIVEQDRICAICHFEFKDYTDVVADHEDLKGMGGA